MTPLPLQSRTLGETVLFVGKSGLFFNGSKQLQERLLNDQLTDDDLAFMARYGHAVPNQQSIAWLSHLYRLTGRAAQPSSLDYLILVPTLRCNLSCSYCQVSRAHLGAQGYDWSEETLGHVLALLDRMEAPSVKIEFQGGEPTLRPDLIQAVIDRAERFEERQFVICTNLSKIDPPVLSLFDRPDVVISTSLDGAEAVHQQNRTISDQATDSFLANLDFVLDRYGPEKISALPTINAHNPPPVEDLIESYASRGLTSIFLRPIVFHGFARKRHAGSREQGDSWRSYYEQFIRMLIERNWTNRDQVLEETYFSLCLRRVFQPGHDRHVDLRNPNPMGIDYIVVDHDGQVYPTDEARMLSRTGVIDLAIGTIAEGWDTEMRAVLDAHATNTNDPDCERCAYQPFCGRDIIDDLARYGRIDIARPETEFCRRHMHVFDLIFSMIYDPNVTVRYSLARWLGLPGIPDKFGLVHDDSAYAAS